jgi:sec-independent protein translocase protein TatC
VTARLPAPRPDPSRRQREREHDARVESHEQPLVEHLIELRSRLLRTVLAILAAFFPLYYFANDLYIFVAAPLLKHLPEGSSMIATEVASPFLTPFKLSLIGAVVGTVPYALHQAWGFVAPGLYSHEKRLAVPLLASSVLLFYAGMAFAYFVVFPLVFGFFVGAAPIAVTVMTDINRYLDFVLTMFFAFGLAFEIPIATFLLVRTGFVSVADLRGKRPYVIVGCFVVGMVLTPPDVLSQTLLSVPMWLLFEAGLLLAAIVGPGGIEEEPHPDDAPAAVPEAATDTLPAERRDA